MSEAAVPNPNSSQPSSQSELTQIQPTQLRSTARSTELSDEVAARSDTSAAGNESIPGNGSHDGNDDGWTTVTFPHATSVDALPEITMAEVTWNLGDGAAAIGGEAGGEPTGSEGYASSSKEASFQELQRQNQELREQVSQLERALATSQSALREEMERWETLALAQPQNTTDQAELIQQHNQELHKAQGRIRELFQELERSHQTAQKQQILVETITVQLQSSHEQIAQLERECALAQQRYTEQMQTFHQMEITCRDLRSRLHRQQRYTLQFKAALEKCLDVPTATYMHSSVPDGVEEPSLVAADLDLLQGQPVKLSIPRSQPVQPWSASYEENETLDPAFQAWMNAFMNGQPVEAAVASDSVTSDSMVVSDSIAASHEQIPPIVPDEIGSSGDEQPMVSYTIQRQVSSEVDHATGPGGSDRLHSPLGETTVQGEAPDLSLGDSVLAADLADPDALSSSLTALPTVHRLDSHLASQSGDLADNLPVSSQDTPPQQPSLTSIAGRVVQWPGTVDAARKIATREATAMASSPSTSDGDGAEAASPLAHLGTPAAGEAGRPAQPGADHDRDSDHDRSEIDDPLAPDVFNEMSEIAPILYPTRSMKKRDSLSAVELPSFPRHS
ncbi:hypothetical protein [Alkalinema sp. FACHB-956]|uniref:hypothetical protein n=1 Tax=Alkalinema sp. FACHB-956 TaxID=2692768 RepID=UPI0016872ADC|nr:hypothetical protein [Alkalinema sp. FACHB-956]MBD2326361.1 hypothetical protein [Alkalinema sp. FACHB-956]